MFVPVSRHQRQTAFYHRDPKISAQSDDCWKDFSTWGEKVDGNGPGTVGPVNTWTTGETPGTNLDWLAINADATLNAQNSGGTALAIISERFWSAQEHKSFQSNPYQIFKPREIYFPEPPKRKLVVM